MSVTFECDGVIHKLRSIGEKDVAGTMVRKLVARGMNIAKPFAQATRSDIAASILADPLKRDGDETTGGFSTNNELSPYIEYGTGLPGHQGEIANGQPRNPAASGFGFTLKTVIQSGPMAGVLRDGWVYFKNGQFFHTQGQPAKPFMYPAQAMLELDVGSIGGVVIRDAIKG